MKCPNCTVDYGDGEQRPDIFRSDERCTHCGWIPPRLDGVLEQLPDRPLTNDDVRGLEQIVGVVGVAKDELSVPALRPRSIYGLVKDEQFLVYQRVRVGLLDETVTYVWKSIEIVENDDGEIWRQGRWKEVDRINTHYWRDPLPYALNEASHEDDDGASAVPGPGQLGNDSVA